MNIYTVTPSTAKLSAEAKGRKMPIDYYGFLGKDIEEFKDELFLRYKEVFEFFEEFNHFLHKMKFDLKVKNFDSWRITIVALFIKSLETFQSIYILTRNCLSIDAEDLTRVLFEEMVKLGYCCIGKDEFKRYMGIHLHDTVRMINAAQNNPGEFPTELFEIKSYSERKKEIDNMLTDQGNPKKINLEGMTRQLGVIKDYNSYYRSVCSPVHSAPKSLEKYLIAGKDGKIEKFVWGPHIEGIIIPLYTAIEFMLRICKFLSDFFGIPTERDILHFSRRIDKLVEKYPIDFQE